MATVPMVSVVLGEAFTGPSGTTYVPNAFGIINVNPADVPFAIQAGAVFAYLQEATIPAPTTAAAGTTQGNAGALPALAGNIYPVSGASGTNGVVLAAADAIVGRQILITNPVAQALLIYPPAGGSATINAGAANAAYTTASAKGALLTCIVAGANSQWCAL